MSDLPLSGWNVLVTRPREQAASLVFKLQQAGAEVLTVPLITIVPPPSYAELDGCLYQLEDYDWIIFASANAVSFFLARMEAITPDADLAKISLAVIGPSTQSKLERAGHTVKFCPDPYNAEAFVEQFRQLYSPAGKKILWPRTNIGRSYLADELTKDGAVVHTALTYVTAAPVDEENAAALIMDFLKLQGPKVVIFTSAQTARNFAGLFYPCRVEDFADRLQDVIVAVIGQETAQAAKEHLGKVDLIATTSTMSGLTRELIRLAASYGK